MNEIICPNCKKAFKVDEAGFADILKQVRDHQFEEEIQQQLALAEKEKVSAIKLAEANVRSTIQQELAQKDKELNDLKAQNALTLTEKLNQKQTEINALQAKMDQVEVEKQLAVTQAIQNIEKERDRLANEIKTKDLEKQNLESSLKNEFTAVIQNKDAIIQYKDEEIARVKDMKMRLSTKMLGETLEQHCEIEFNKLRATAFQKSYFEKDSDS
ncbi:MAG: DUF2130 domain-containing protein, partial [Flavobacteriales bacterium]